MQTLDHKSVYYSVQEILNACFDPTTNGLRISGTINGDLTFNGSVLFNTNGTTHNVFISNGSVSSTPTQSTDFVLINPTASTNVTASNSPTIKIYGTVYDSNLLGSRTKASCLQMVMNPANAGIGELVLSALKTDATWTTMVNFGGLDGGDNFSRGFWNSGMTFNGTVAALTWFLQNSSGFGLVPTFTYLQTSYLDNLIIRSGDIGKSVYICDGQAGVNVTGINFKSYVATSLNQRSATEAITASTTQTQGQGVLTTEINEVAICANVNDTVTLPSAAVGYRVVVINNGANTLQIFPASGDDLGAGLNTATTLAVGSNREFVAYNQTNWEVV